MLEHMFESLVPGPAAMAELATCDPSAIGANERVDLLVAWSRQLAWAHGQVMSVMGAMAELDDRPINVAGRVVEHPIHDEVAAALRVSLASAGRQVETARSLRLWLPRTARALCDGTLSIAHAQAIVDSIPPEWTADSEARSLFDELEARVLPLADRQTPPRLRQAVQRAIIRIRPGEAQARCERAASFRAISMWPEPDGMACLQARLPARAALAVFSSIDSAARRHLAALKAQAPDETDPTGASGPAQPPAGHRQYGIDAARADMLVALAAGAGIGVDGLAPDGGVLGHAVPGAGVLGNGSGGRADGNDRQRAAIVIDLPTALGLADNPGEIPGYGPVPGPVARQIAADSTWQRWLAEPGSGRLLDMGRKWYTPPPTLREHIRARDATCRFPGCNQPAHRCDLDHAIPWDSGGCTDAANLGALCRRHHRLKTAGAWSITASDRDGSCEWQSSLGQVVATEARQPLPD